MNTILRTCAICAICLLNWSQAFAVCAGAGIQNLPRYVGDTDKSSPSYDSKCTDNDIQSAINNTVCPNTPIYITGEHTYTKQALNIQGKWLSLIGSTELCGVVPASPTTDVRTISGAGQTSSSVITIGGTSTVTLEGIEVTGGQVSGSSSGGGIFFNGTGSLTLNSTLIFGNSAGYGGGINMSPSGGDATLTIGSGTIIEENTAQQSGGGILVSDNTRLFMLAPNSTVILNTAGTYGGGIAIAGPARADIGSPGLGFSGTPVTLNTAKYGGGIAIVAQPTGNAATGSAVARIFSTNATSPVSINNNSATSQGGGIYLQGNGGNQTFATLCAFEFNINDNTAPDGAAIFGAGTAAGQGANVADDNGIQLNAGGSVDASGDALDAGQCGPEPISQLGAVDCAANTPCNEISGNIADPADSNGPGGSVISISGYTFFEADRVQMRQNSGAQIVDLVIGLYSFMRNSLIADNHSTHEVIHSEQLWRELSLDQCTLANNAIDNGYVIFGKAGLSMNNDLIFEPKISTLDYQEGNTSLNVDCEFDAFCLFVNFVISTETASLRDPSFSLQLADPLFVDPNNSNISARDYHLQAKDVNGVVTVSQAVDFAPTIPADGNDLDNNPRGQEIPFAPNVYGPTDVGAYEVQPLPDVIFSSGFGDPPVIL
jgi:predicted outer membrane repeat protein